MKNELLKSSCLFFARFNYFKEGSRTVGRAGARCKVWYRCFYEREE